MALKPFLDSFLKHPYVKYLFMLVLALAIFLFFKDPQSRIKGVVIAFLGILYGHHVKFRSR